MRIADSPKPRRDMDLIGLINAVFLLLVFFVVTGTIAPRPPDSVELAATPEGAARPAPAQALALDAQGTWMIAASPASTAGIAAWLAGRDPQVAVEIWVDARLDARRFQERLRDVEALAGRIVTVITTRAGAP
jgi:biopolymer transport protein ExbD